MKKNTKRSQSISCLVHSFLHVNRLRRAMSEEQISKLGVHSSQHHMLAIIAGSKNICQKEIAQKLEISSAAVAVTLNKLEASGLIERNQSFDDARMNHITITDKGKDILKSSKAMFDAMDEKCFEGITDEEIALMTGLLDKMTENLRALRQETSGRPSKD